MDFDINRASFHKRTRFKPFNIDKFIEPIGLESKQEGVLVFEIGNKHYGLLTKQMIYHHVANGQIDDEAFMISF